MQQIMNKNEIVNEIRRLNVIERLNIVTDIWDEIKESQALEGISEEDKRILINRLSDYKKNPKTSTDWKDLKQEVYNRYAKQS